MNDYKISKGLYRYKIKCEKKGCGCEGEVYLIGQVKNARLQHKFDHGVGIPIELTHPVIWDDEDLDMRRSIF